MCFIQSWFIGIILLGSYILGSIPFCYLIGKIIKKKDLKKIGDKNPGGWNLIFNVSKVWGIIGTLLDVAKGALAYYLALRFSNVQLIALFAGCLAVAGHNHSIFLKFSGGKGVATTLGFFLILNPFLILVYGATMVSALLLLRNMILSITITLIMSGLFLFFLYDLNYIFLLMTLLLIIFIVPNYINSRKSIAQNLRVSWDVKVKDLFVPKER
jgi:acyl phosphate:glycerol-3-phosphate acyltransferase